MFKILKEGEISASSDGRILYHGELRGFRYPDGTEIQVSNFSSDGTYQLSWWDNGKEAGYVTKHGDEEDAIRLIKTIIVSKYETADEAFYDNY